ncbi:MAG: PKD domain-containing protein [Bacteroidales bacterium]|nr:PKD domain-containing protein [Bacteroidales bacterium]
MKLQIITLALSAAFLAGAADISPVFRHPDAPRAVQVARQRMPLFNSESPAINADFTVEGSGSLAPVTSYDFNTDMQGWTPEPKDYVTWKIIPDAQLGAGKGYSTIDPSSTGSLFVEGPYQVYRREKSAITSPEIAVPSNGSLSFHVGFSLNYDDVCRLTLSISTDNFESSEVIWNSKDAGGEKPWAWREAIIALDKYVGKNVRLKFEYGPGSSDSFDTGGYMGDFAIDGLKMSGRTTVDNVSVNTGDIVSLMDISAGSPVAWEWNFPGGVPEKSTEKIPKVYYTTDGSFDISLTVRDADGQTSTKTRTGFVKVTGSAPVAAILPPATFRLSSNRKHLVAPLAPVTFRDASSGFPTEHSWTFTGVAADGTTPFISTETDPAVSFAYLHDQKVDLTASNSHGSSQASCEVTAEYSGTVNNLLPTDRATVFDMEDWGVFPGSNNRKITAYAEKFSAPSVPIRVYGAYVFFQEATAESVADQIANVGVHLYTAKDGKPDKCLDSMWWSVFELDLPSGGQAVGTAFPFTTAPVVSDEFFIVVDGIPEFSETTRVSFGMADFRAEGGTAMMLKEGEWINVADYFPAGKNHTSFMIYPAISHSVMSHLTPVDGIANVGKEAGTADFEIFSYMGYETPVSDADWLKVTSTPNGMTVDTVKAAYEALPPAVSRREGHITLTDGATQLLLTVKQNAEDAAVEEIEIEGIDDADEAEYYNLQGIRVTDPAPGQILIRRTAGTTVKIRY